ARDLKVFEALRHWYRGDDFFRDLSRGLAELLRQLERERHGKLAHLDLGGRVDDDARRVDVVLLAEEFADVMGQLLLSFQVHDGSRSFSQLGGGSLRGMRDGTLTRKPLGRMAIITKACIDAGLTLLPPLPMMKVPTTPQAER